MSSEKFHEEMARVLFCKKPSELTDDTVMSRDSGTLDSMGETEIVFLCEDILNTKVSFDEIVTAGTYGNFKNTLRGKGAEL